MKIWFIYILECADGSLYTGITNDLDKRIKAHSEGKGAKYTKGRGPFKLLHCFMHPSKSSASQREAEIKKWPKEEKIRHIEYWSEKKNRIPLFKVIQTLKEEGWNTDWILDESNTGNNSTYVIWKKGDKELYLGNYFIQSEQIGAFPWADPYVTKEHVLAALEGDTKKAFNY
ncbi:MAG TPA: GIY-YIG nuclease family protein [Allocoleopsis sp.]